jgi:hypothetical protein
MKSAYKSKLKGAFKETPDVKRYRPSSIVKIIVIWLLAVNIVVIVNFIRVSIFGKNLYEELSFKFMDQPWVPPGTLATPIISNHYFGDFLLTYNWGKFGDPYNPDLELPFGGTPAMYFFLKFFSILPLRFAFAVFLLTTVVVLFKVLNSILIDVDIWMRSLILILLVGFSAPFWISVDRGAFVIISLCFFAFAVERLKSERVEEKTKRRIFMFFFISINLKYYMVAPLFLLVIVYRRRQDVRRLILEFIVIIISINVALTFFIRGGLIGFFNSFIRGVISQSGGDDPFWLYSGVGLNHFVFTFWIKECSATDLVCANSYLEFIPLVTIFSLVPILYICVSTRYPVDYKIVLAYSTLMIAPTVAMAYNLSWVILATAVLIRKIQNTHPCKLDLFLLICLIGMNLPSPLTGVFPSPFYDWRFVPPIANTLIAYSILFLGKSRRIKLS